MPFMIGYKCCVYCCIRHKAFGKCVITKNSRMHSAKFVLLHVSAEIKMKFCIRSNEGLILLLKEHSPHFISWFLSIEINDCFNQKWYRVLMMLMIHCILIDRSKMVSNRRKSLHSTSVAIDLRFFPFDVVSFL